VAIKELGLKKSFTLLELMVVIVILGVLAALGLRQYQETVRRSRAAEARQIIAQLRSQCAGIYMAEKDTANCTAGNLRLNTAASCIADMIPGGQCCSTHFFSYAVSGEGGDDITFTATRCTSGGKEPQGLTNYNIILEVNFATGTDTWSGELW